MFSTSGGKLRVAGRLCLGGERDRDGGRHDQGEDSFQGSSGRESTVSETSRTALTQYAPFATFRARLWTAPVRECGTASRKFR